MLELMFLEAGCLRLDFQRCSLRGSVNKTRAEDGNVPLNSATALAIGPHRKRDVGGRRHGTARIMAACT